MTMKSYTETDILSNEWFINRLHIGMNYNIGVPSHTILDSIPSEKEKAEFFMLLMALSSRYTLYKNDEEFMDSLKEIYGEDCEKHFNEVLRPLGLLPRQ